MWIAFLDVSVDVVANDVHFGAVFEIVWIIDSIVANVLRCLRAQEGVLQTRSIGSVEIYDLFVDALFLQEVQRQARMVRPASPSARHK